MRTKMVVISKDGELTEGYSERSQVSDNLADMLAVLGLSFIILANRNGQVVQYHAWEYECEWCGEYGHSIESCQQRNEV